MNTRQLIVATALSIGAVGIAGQASASEVEIAGSIFWGASSPTTLFSKAGEISNFFFDVDSALPAGSPSTTTSFSGFEYSLNNVNVTPTLASVTFYDLAQQGMFDLNFGGAFTGDTVSIYGANIGNVGTTNTITTGGNYLVTAALQGGTFTATGDTVVAVSAVPLPAALPLFGAVVGGLGFFGRWRARRVATA